MISRRSALLSIPAFGLAATARAADAPVPFAVGPFQPTAGDTRRAYEPYFK